MEKRAKSKKSILKIISGIIDIIVYPVILFSLCAGCFMLISKAEKNFTSVAGISFVRVLTNSMSTYCDEVQRSFFSGDVCILKAKTTYSVGDVIAFYEYVDSVDENSTKLNLTECEVHSYDKKDKDGNVIEGTRTTKWYPVKDENGNVRYNYQLQTLINSKKIGEEFEDNYGNTYTKQAVPTERTSLQEIEKKKDIRILFHQIVQIEIDQTGTIFYITKGTSNGDATTELVRSDLALGSYIPSSGWLTNFIGFCSSSTGLILLVIVPVSIMIFFEALSVLGQAGNIVLEKNVLSRKIEFDSIDCKKAKVFEEMVNYNKIYLYDVMSSDYKDDLFECLWGYLGNSKSRKNKKLYAVALNSAQNYDENNLDAYYESWYEIYSSKGQKAKLSQIRKKADKDRYKDVKIFEYQNYTNEQLKEQKVEKIENTKKNTVQDKSKVPPKTISEQKVEKPVEKAQTSVPQQPKPVEQPKIVEQPKPVEKPKVLTKPQKPQKIDVTFEEEDKKRLEEILGRIKQHK